MVNEDPIVSGRACGTCTLCCKLLAIAELDKPGGVWCRHCDIGHGCRIYAERPSVCQSFYCAYLTSPGLGEHWFPGRSKMVVVSELDADRIIIQVDPSRPTAWREQPYYSEIKQWARQRAQDLAQVVVCVRDRTIVILPDEDVDIGIVADNERIALSEIIENGRLRLRAMKLRADDPRLAGAESGEIHVRGK